MPTALPKREIFVLCCVLISEAFTMTMMLPFAVFMVQDFKVVPGDRSLGYLVGLMAMSFGLCHFVASIIWNRISDSYGRKPVLLFGQLFSTALMVLFGMSQNYTWAILTRAVMGLANGNSGIAKTYLSESTDASNRQRAFTIIGAVWSAGVILGPFIGGFLARPVIKYPAIFGDSVFLIDNPYIIPCLISAIISLCGFVFGILWLRETLDFGLDEDIKMEEEKGRGQPQPQTAVKAGDIDINIESDGDGDDDESKPLKGGVIKSPHTNEAGEKSNTNSHSTLLERRKTASFNDYFALLKLRRVSVIMWLLAISALIQIMFSEGFAIWCIGTPNSDRWGLGFHSGHIGVIMTVAGVTLVLMQILYPRLAQLMGHLNSFRLGMLVNIPITFVFPLLTLLQPSGPWALWPVLIAATIIRAAALTVSFTSVFVLVNSSVSRDLTSHVNRLGQTISALARAIGPLVGGFLLTWSLENHDKNVPPFNHYFIFLIIAVFALVAWIVSFGVRLAKPEAEEKAEKNRV